jgi:uncharacterized protein (TIGR01244 family)
MAVCSARRHQAIHEVVMTTPPKRLTDALSVAAQIAPDDVAWLAAQGFRSIINNRPDGEVPRQPANADIAAMAAQHGLAYQYLPVISGQLHDADVEGFAQALASLPTPALAFCRSGTRSTTLWALGAARRLPVEEVVHAAALAGYNLDELRSRLQQAASH